MALNTIEIYKSGGTTVLLVGGDGGVYRSFNASGTWFRLGHGVVLDSANHFEGQGFLSAPDVRSPEERMAYAVDHLGLTYARLRELRKEKFWGKTGSTAEHVKDLSVFRVITNFVWLKRLAEE